MPVVDGHRLVEAEEEREPPRSGDQHRVGDELPDAVPVDRERGHVATSVGGAAEDGDDLGLLLLADPRPERQAEVLARRALRLGQVALGVAEVAQRRLEVERRLVVRRVADLGLGERGGEPVALGRADAVHVVDVARLVGRELDDLAEPELRVPRGGLAAQPVPPVDAAAGRCGASRPAARRGASCSRRTRTPSSRASRGSAASGPARRAPASLTATRPPSPKREEVLRREEAERRGDARRDPGRAEGLRGVLDDRQAEPPQRLDRRRAAEQVHGHDRLRPLRDPPLDVGRVEVQRRRVDVGEDGRRAAPGDRLGGRVERERRADDLVALADAERVEHEHERVGAVRDADRLLDAEVARRPRARSPRPRARR